MTRIKILAIIILVAIAFSGCLSDYHFGEDYTDVTVQKKMIDVSKEGSHYLLVTDKGVFEVDRPLMDYFSKEINPDAVYSKIEEGRRYKLHHYGYRIDFEYDYPIVVGAEEIK